MTPDDAAGFEALLGRTTKAVIVAGSVYDSRRRKNNEVLASEDRPEALHALRVALRLQPGGQRYDWMTPGEPTLALEDAEGNVLATVTCLLPDFVRSSALEGDAPLAQPGLLGAWLDERAAGRSG